MLAEWQCLLCSWLLLFFILCFRNVEQMKQKMQRFFRSSSPQMRCQGPKPRLASDFNTEVCSKFTSSFQPKELAEAHRHVFICLSLTYVCFKCQSTYKLWPRGARWKGKMQKGCLCPSKSYSATGETNFVFIDLSLKKKKSWWQQMFPEWLPIVLDPIRGWGQISLYC